MKELFNFENMDYFVSDSDKRELLQYERNLVFSCDLMLAKKYRKSWVSNVLDNPKMDIKRFVEFQGSVMLPIIHPEGL